MEIRMVDLKSQYEKIKPEIDEAIQQVIDSTAFIKGPYVKNFADNLASFLGVNHVIPCANGTDALQIALMALDMKPGDEVITTPFTFVATVETIVLLGLKPVFVDVDPDTFNIDPNLIEAAITDRTKCIIPVHLFGQSADMDRIMKIALNHDLYVIEDAAQAIGANYTYEGKEKKCSTIGDIGTFSFFPSKNLGCFGDGGAICTNNEQLAHKINLLANHGSSNKYYYDDIGVNSRLDAIQAAVLDVKLKYLDEYNLARRKAADSYDSMLSDIEILQTPVRARDRNHVFHQYTLKIGSSRNEIQSLLREAGIPSAIYYPVPLYSQSVYKKYDVKKGGYPVTESLCNSVLSLPMHSELNEEMQIHITNHLKEAIQKSGIYSHV
ncbi:MAG: DegT/DnrJ/EryC1/StrS family aminotransferase [Bacteroidia bacterium]|nr:DegT/DnrJ/EryC1/StrS family aminotransferase [Bacteroidia bacterium]